MKLFDRKKAATALSASLLSLSLFAAQSVFAEEIRIPLGQQGGVSSIATPASGTSEEQVLLSFGAPSGKSAPVGDPPIARWEYAKFVVYFEYDRVIHTVLKR